MRQASKTDATSSVALPAGGGLSVPADRETRVAIREKAEATASTLCRCVSLDRVRMESAAAGMLRELGLDNAYTGFAMVALGTAWWREQFAAVPFEGRVLMLPHCLRKRDACRGSYTAHGLVCAACGACPVAELEAEARGLGYRVLVSEGTPAVVQTLADEHVEGILGVACLESLERCFEMVFRLGMPYAAVPLLKNGCVETTIEMEAVQSLLRARSDKVGAVAPGYGPLLGQAKRLFDEIELRRLLDGELRGRAAPGCGDAISRTEDIVVEWLARAGKRFRPFITLASYAALHGRSDTPSDDVRRIAVAMELFHKASLVHDDVEDDDATRYGEPTIHASYGVPTAINAGDHLLGLGYRLVAAQAPTLGAECVTDILARLSDAHVKLCRGQGAELLMTRDASLPAGASDVMAMYALKTAPAFFVAMYAGMRMAGPVGEDGDRVSAFCRHLGVGYQILDDLDDLDAETAAGQSVGQDFVQGRPTVLRALAVDAGAGAKLDALRSEAALQDRKAMIAGVREVYEATGAIEKSRRLVAKCRHRAMEVIDEVEAPGMRELMLFLLRMVLGQAGSEDDRDQ